MRDDETLGAAYLRAVTEEFEKQKALADAAMEQLDDAGFFAKLDPEANSVAVIVKHMAGNLRSRWREFLTTDGEKPDRHRDQEFEVAESRAALLRAWEAGWQTLFGTLHALTPDDLLRTVHIRGQALSVLEALERALTHAAQHSGQIVLLAKHACGPTWRTLSIPKGRSEDWRRGGSGAEEGAG
jgi:hypothetical protein